jgi:lipopolysaccharide biosynthesis regulator YciM
MRANIALCDYYIVQNKPQKALQILHSIPELDIDFTEVILDRLLKLHQQQGSEQELIGYLYNIVSMGAGASAVILLAQLIAKYHGIEKAQEFMLQELQRNTTMKGFNHLMTYHLQLAQSTSEKESLTFLQKLVSEQITLRPKYRCQKCGYSSKKLYWQCPSCKNWGRIKPIRGLDGE